MLTAVIQIGNSDNKLTQSEWAHYCAGVHLAVSSNVFRIHFKGGSDWDAPWQNACWVVELRHHEKKQLVDALAMEAHNARQDSIAAMFGETEFIQPWQENTHDV